MRPAPSQPSPAEMLPHPSNTTVNVAAAVTLLISLGIASLLVLGLLALSYNRYQAQIAASTSSTGETATVTGTDNSAALDGPALVREDNLGQLLLAGGARLILQLIAFGLVIGLSSYARSRLDRFIFDLFAWLFATLTFFLALVAVLRFTFSPSIPGLEWAIYAGLTLLLMVQAVVLTHLARKADNCRRFAWVLVCAGGLQIVLLLVQRGLSLGATFLANLGYLSVLAVAVLVLLYLAKILGMLYQAEGER